MVWLAASASITPRQFRARLLLAELLHAQRDVEDARTQLEEALRVNPGFERARDAFTSAGPGRRFSVNQSAGVPWRRDAAGAVTAPDQPAQTPALPWLERSIARGRSVYSFN